MYNILKSHNARPMSAGNMMSKLEVNDQHLEANLCTMLQTVCGTTQFWFAKQGELRCMVRQLGTRSVVLNMNPTTRTVNDVPDSYNTGKLCTEDPVFVSRQLSNKFHAFFKKVLLKRKILETVDH